MQCLGDGEIRKAQDLALTALKRQPMNQMAMAVLGSAEDLKGDRQKADAWFRSASALGHRDYTVETYWAQRSLERGDLVGAAAHIDALLRAGWKGDPVKDLALQLENIPAGRMQLVRVMIPTSPWAVGYLSTVSDLTPSQLAARRDTLLLIADVPAALIESEKLRLAVPTIEALYRAKRFEEALSLRNKFPPFGPPAGIRDPLFKGLASEPTGPFDWKRGNDAGLDLQVGKGSAGQSGLILSAVDPGRYIVATQTVRLLPGTHQLVLAGRSPSDAKAVLVVKMEGLENGEKLNPLSMRAPNEDAPSKAGFAVSGKDRYFRMVLSVEWSDGDATPVEVSSISENVQ
ncbi:hypothetical protein [Novosphingobium cyanobacteriorum]|uniref:Uncharacterized protein n=1 Tax=Novosphingobium cyanobacteriorum TaxID=3024215 RepID=A0ABT6CM40_9SPHN|nr:hypothetical protein [Novosphingobium cyanobacteriorum]MDF8334986.1 hypothetical protein [Novosphingobium cyanobacteriorum]